MNEKNAYQETILKLFITILFSFCIAIAGTVLLGVCIKNRTDVNALIQEAVAVLPLEASDLQPEPWEMTGYVFLWLLFFFAFAITYFITEKKKLANKWLELLTVVSCVLLLAGFVYAFFFAEEDEFYINMSYYMSPIIAILITALMLLAIVLLQRMNICRNKIIMIGCDSISLIMILFAARVCYVPVPVYGTNMFHANGFFTAIYNVYYGATLGVDFIPEYGTYAYLFVPIFKIIGFTMRKYAFIIMLMCLVIMLCWFYVIRSLIRNPILKVLSLASAIYLDVYFAINAHGEQFIAQHFPFRIFFPTIMVAYVAFGMNKKIFARKAFQFVGFTITVCSLIMNLESGITTTSTWAAVCFAVGFSSLKEKHIHDNNDNIIGVVRCEKNKLFRLLAAVVVRFLSAIILWIGTIVIVGYIRTGSIVNISDLFYTSRVFAQIGYGMLPLPNYLHVYIFVFLLLAISLGFSLCPLFSSKKVYVKDTITTLALSVTGILMLIYYMGRTHNRSLFQWLFPCVILISFFADRFIDDVKGYRRFRGGIRLMACGITTLLISILSVYSFSILYVLHNSELYNDFRYRQNTGYLDDSVKKEIEILMKYENEDGTINYFGDYAAILSLYVGLENTYLGKMPTDLYAWEEYESLMDWIKNTEGAIILDSRAMSQIELFEEENFDAIIKEKNYGVIDESGMSKVYGHIE